MGVILAGLNALSTFHPEQNPALQGGGVYQSHAQQDKQIVRIIGKMTTLAAHAYHRNTGRTPAPPNQKLGYAEVPYMLGRRASTRTTSPTPGSAGRST